MEPTRKEAACEGLLNCALSLVGFGDREKKNGFTIIFNQASDRRRQEREKDLPWKGKVSTEEIV